MEKELKQMTDKELIAEWEYSEKYIDAVSYGKADLYHRQNIIKELNQRGLQVE